MKFIKNTTLFKESMRIVSDPNYSKYNLEIDGVDPMSLSPEVINKKSVLSDRRRVAWVDVYDDFTPPSGYSMIKMFDLDNPNSESGKVGIRKIKDLGRVNSMSWALKFINGEYILYNDKYKGQAEKAHREFIKRGGWWNQTDPKSDIYLARLMGYGEEYIVPYIRKYFPTFDVESYIKENPRKETLDIE
jgi:hypothetical protein